MNGERFGPVDFDHFHRERLPALLETCGPLFTAADAAVLRPIAFRLKDGRAYTYVPSGRTFSVEPGCDRAETVATLPEEEWHDFVWELRSAFACFYADRLSLTGKFGQLVRWEPPLRVALDGQVVYDVDDPPPVLDGSGQPVDLTATFGLSDDESEIADFLHRTGFVHLRNVLDATEVEALRVEVDRAVAGARPHDRRSWWTVVDGEEVCCRVNYLNDQSPLVAGLGDDDRFLRIAALGRADLRDARDRLDGNGVVIKVPGAGEGLADLPWHRDCGMGGHPVKCPMLNVGIQLDMATPATGQLEMIAGSHRGTSRLPHDKEAARLPVARLSTEPGDVTVHFGHTLHAAPPPTRRSGAGRRALYLSFVPPRSFEMVGPGQGYNDVLFTRDDGRVRHVDQLT
ncbi:MAG: phytanoyl-CoA dioxygenase family protein [Acidimicrobiales bacterium]